MPVIAIMLVLGGLGGVSNWIIAPTKGLLVAAQDGNLPLCFQKSNQYGAPTLMIVGQAVIVTLLSSFFLFMPSVNGSYWLLTALAAQLYMLMYLLMFATGIMLRLKAPQHPRAFRIPGGLFGMIAVAGIGSLGALTTLVVSFMPPEGIDVGSVARYEVMLIVGLLIMCSPPLVATYVQRRRRRLTRAAECS